MQIHRYPAAFSIVAALCLVSTASLARTVTVKGSAPTVTVEVPDTFKSSKTDRGIEAKTPDDEVLVWFEVYPAQSEATVLEEHQAYWKDQGVELGADPARASQDLDGKKVSATDYKSATWQGKPTVVRYLAIDAALPSKQLVLMSLWASPRGDEQHDAEVTKMISGMEIKD